jgi:ABC-2 type transport system permease protein
VSAVRQLGRQVRYTNLAFWRNPASAFFTFAFPLMFLVIFTSLLGTGLFEVTKGVFIQQDRYYVAAMASFAVITATYTNLAMSVSFQRDSGVLKRLRGTPLPGSVYLSARVAHAIAIGVLLVVITAVFGIVVYDAAGPTGVRLLEFVVVIVVGAMAFSALGLATTSIVPNAEAAPAVVNAIILPLLFLSGIFIPIRESSPQWMKAVGDVFPVKHFEEAVMGSFYGSPLPFHWDDVLVVAVWGVVGLVLATRFFSWEPRK